MTEAGRGQGATSPVVPGAPYAVRWIVALAVALFVVQLTVLAPADMEAALGFASRDLGRRWWTVVTFTLVHTNAWPLAANVLAIGTFGSVLERRWGTGEFVRYYIVCALGGWVAHVTFVPGSTVLAGGAAPAIGLILAYAAGGHDKRHLVIGALSMSAGWVAVLGTTGVLLAGIATTDPGDAAAYLAHAGGLVAGWVFLRTASSVNLTRIREGVSPVPDEPDDMAPRAIPRGQPRAQRTEDDVVARSNAAVAREVTARRSAPPADNRDAKTLDGLLDKISAHGIDSLTPDERTLLDDVSRRLRDH